VIDDSYGDGSTICFVGLQISSIDPNGSVNKLQVANQSAWITDPRWRVTAAANRNGPAASVLTRDCLTFWNSDVNTAAEMHHGPWNLTLDLSGAYPGA
jgi:hypothetical protein